MASLQILKPTLSQFSLSNSNFPKKCILNPSQSYFHKRIIKLQTLTSSKSTTLFRVFCQAQNSNNNKNVGGASIDDSARRVSVATTNGKARPTLLAKCFVIFISISTGEEPPESLFMKELKRRGMSPTSLLEDYKKGNYGLDEEVYVNEEDRGFPNRKYVSTDVERSLDNQRERSMALNSEGLEGLAPRAKLLLTTGGTFFLGFGPLIIVTVAFFSAIYFYFGPSFVHDASKMYLSPPQYVDPYELLEDERISQMAPPLN